MEPFCPLFCHANISLPSLKKNIYFIIMVVFFVLHNVLFAANSRNDNSCSSPGIIDLAAWTSDRPFSTKHSTCYCYLM